MLEPEPAKAAAAANVLLVCMSLYVHSHVSMCLLQLDYKFSSRGLLYSLSTPQHTCTPFRPLLIESRSNRLEVAT